MDRPAIALIGGGNRAKRVVEHLVVTGKTRLAYCFDTSRRAAEHILNDFSLEAPIPESADAIFGDERVAAVFVMTPQFAHREYAERTVDAGKALYIEKPIATTAEDALAIWRKVSASGLPAQTGFVLRHAPFYKKAKEIVDSGRLGEINFLRGSEYLTYREAGNFLRAWRRKVDRTGGFLSEKCSHDLDILNWLGNTTPRAVVGAQGESFLAPRPDRPMHCTDCDDPDCRYRCAPSASVPVADMRILCYVRPEVAEDPKAHDQDLCVYNCGADIKHRGSFVIEMASGAVASFGFHVMSGRPLRELEVIGSEGALWGNAPSNRLHVRLSRSGTVETYDVSEEAARSSHYGGDRHLMDHFIRSVRGEVAPLGDLRDGVVSCLTAFACERASAEGRRVELAELTPEDLRASLLGGG